MLLLLCCWDFLLYRDAPVIDTLWNLERPALRNICSSSRASLDGVDHVGAQSPGALLPSFLGHCRYRSATSLEVSHPRVCVHLKRPQGSTRALQFQFVQRMAVLSKPVRESSPPRADFFVQQYKPVQKKKRGQKAKSGRKKKPVREDSPELEESSAEEELAVRGRKGTQMSTGIYRVPQPTPTSPSLLSHWIDEYLDHCIKFEDMTPIDAESFRDMIQKTECTDKDQMKFVRELLTYREKNLSLAWVMENIILDRAIISPLHLTYVPVTQSLD